MEENRGNDTASESGIALVMVMIVALAILLFVTGVSFLMLKGLRASVIHKEFASVYEAANGGVEHAAGLIATHWQGGSVTGMGKYDGNQETVLNCSSSTDSFIVATLSADGKYKVEITVSCLGKQAIPGAGGALAFPPPKGLSGGGSPVWYIFYSIVATAEESENPKNRGRTEAVYKIPA